MKQNTNYIYWVIDKDVLYRERYTTGRDVQVIIVMNHQNSQNSEILTVNDTTFTSDTTVPLSEHWHRCLAPKQPG